MNDHFWKREILISVSHHTFSVNKKNINLFFLLSTKRWMAATYLLSLLEIAFGSCFATVWISFCNLVWLLGLVCFLAVLWKWKKPNWLEHPKRHNNEHLAETWYTWNNDKCICCVPSLVEYLQGSSHLPHHWPDDQYLSHTLIMNILLV